MPMMSEDEFFVQRCLSGEKGTFGALVDKYKDAVCGLAHSKVHNFHDAQDIAQEVFIAAYRNLRSLRYPHRFSSWIYTITANHCRTWLRKQSRESLVLASIEELGSKAGMQDQAAHQNPKGQISERILDAINELPEASRLVMTLYYIDGLTCKEIGEFTGTSINTVMSKLRRARAKLRKEFTEMPAQTMTQQRVHSGFTDGVLRAIEHLSPAPQAPSNPISRIIGIP
jgi:RNA polymerase sigma factor (sigma-70 family)